MGGRNIGILKLQPDTIRFFLCIGHIVALAASRYPYIRIVGYRARPVLPFWL